MDLKPLLAFRIDKKNANGALESQSPHSHFFVLSSGLLIIDRHLSLS